MTKISAAVALVTVFLLGATGAQAATHDGSWNMVVKTTRGHCGVIQVGLGVEKGRVFSTGGWFAFYPIDIGGRVTTGGRVSMKAVAGPRTAYGTGRFGRSRAQGTWRGRGPSGLCSGIWTANRI